jgi:hypothetical protein
VTDDVMKIKMMMMMMMMMILLLLLMMMMMLMLLLLLIMMIPRMCHELFLSKLLFTRHSKTETTC